MTIISLDFDSLPLANPATPPTGFDKPSGSDPGKIFGAAPKLFGSASGSTSMWYCLTELPGNVIKVSITLPATPSSDPVGCAFINAAGNGFMVITGTGLNNFRIFAVTNGQLSGSPLMTASVAPLGNATVEFWRTISGANHQYEVFQNAVKVGTTYTNNTVTATFGAVVARPNSSVRAMAVEYTLSQTIATLTAPLVPGAAFSGTTTGFVNGAATLSFGGISVAVTIVDGAFDGTVPSLADNIAFPVLPGSGVTVTLTQGATVATVLRDVSLPVGFEVTRDDSDNPSNFAGMVTDDPTYLPYAYDQAGNPLTELDRCYFPTTRNLNIRPNGEVSADAGLGSFTVTIYIHRNGGNIYSHDITISESGQLVSGGTITFHVIEATTINAEVISAVVI